VIALTAPQILIVVAWFLMAILIGFVVLIARFYEDVSGERTYYPAYFVTILCFAGASARSAFTNAADGDPLATVLWVIGAVSLAFLCVYLYNLMTARQKKMNASTKEPNEHADVR
jgi:tellurite resistance protein TehA-like permease